MPDLLSYLYIAPAALIAIIFHEVSHGLMSYWLGDPTPKVEGRLTLNPMKHLDPIGTLCLIVFKFGWAKPVRVNPRYYKNPKWGMALVGLAGPLANYLTAFLAGLFCILMIRFAPATQLTEIVCTFLMYVIMINVGLGTFNLIPIPPLDGSKIVGAILPEEAYYYLPHKVELVEVALKDIRKLTPNRKKVPITETEVYKNFFKISH